MRIAVIGAGNMGRALAGSLVRAGHEVSIAFGRDEAKIAAAAQETAAQLAAPDVAVAAAEIVLLTVPPEAIDAALAATGSLAGLIVVSVSSGLTLDPTGGQVGLPTHRTASVAEEVAAKAEGARVVQSFTLAFAELIAAGGDGQAVLPVAGDDAVAVAKVSKLVKDIGFIPLPCGGLRSARALESLATAFAQFGVVANVAPMAGMALTH
ncbi:NADPH-dependent F420 reductase [Mycolicibacterium hodleri]|uniref:Pyrroline-5-carboxylate reductase catalytic N-terminal domain-containing protein n=1 Tax=Mycolicibacterium hodleri TaxID=49897 RepID=A0A502ECN4_9MYCO|nr:NAD(P)-binding domain-containing protein [Mycolicibacterium hodleri]TPG34141.1 hypothetical protein EAH80_11025 [Mycolicibacterium hodleri]